MAELITPPDLVAFAVFCENCAADRTVHMSKEADAETGEVYYEYICDECDSLLLTITPVKSSVSSLAIGEHP